MEGRVKEKQNNAAPGVNHPRPLAFSRPSREAEHPENMRRCTNHSQA
jgi:hypothetical protein